MLQSQLFTGDQLLQEIADDRNRERINRTRHTPSDSVQRIQLALLTWRPDILPQFGADSKYGDETAGAVKTFKAEELQVPANQIIDDVGPLTVQRLDEIQKAAEDGPAPVLVQVRVRRDVWKLQPVGNAWHPIVEAYAKAVQRMKQELPGDPQSWHWSYQRDVHGKGVINDQFINQCQHSTAYFLSWHRMYLAVFEQIVIDVIAALPDISDEVKTTWALPYWDYDRPDSKTLPPAFREQQLANGDPNPLLEQRRNPRINDANNPVALSDPETTAAIWINQQFFSVSAGSSFGGLQVGRNHRIGTHPFGAVESQPHNAVHGFIGGLMNDGDQAAFDPIFWCHHANIDRLWEIWRNEHPGGDPNDQGWTSDQFSFRTTSGTVTFASSQVVDTVRALHYTYENTSRPASARPPVIRPLVDAAQPPGERPMQRIGGLDDALQLVDGSPHQITIDTAAVDRLIEAIGEPPRVQLSLDHVTIEGGDNPPSYGAYLQPAGEGADEILVGVLAFFGTPANEANDEDFSFAFDLTDIADQLAQVEQWDPARINLVFRPLNEEWLAANREAAQIPTITVGSVNVSIQ